MAPVFHDAKEDVAQFRLTLRIAMPFREHRGRDFNVAAQLLRGMAAQK